MPEYKEFVLTIHTKDAAGDYPLCRRGVLKGMPRAERGTGM